MKTKALISAFPMNEAEKKKLSRIARKTPKRIIEQRKPGPVTILQAPVGVIHTVNTGISTSA